MVTRSRDTKGNWVPSGPGVPGDPGAGLSDVKTRIVMGWVVSHTRRLVRLRIVPSAASTRMSYVWPTPGAAITTAHAGRMSARDLGK